MSHQDAPLPHCPYGDALTPEAHNAGSEVEM